MISSARSADFAVSPGERLAQTRHVLFRLTRRISCFLVLFLVPRAAIAPYPKINLSNSQSAQIFWGRFHNVKQKQ
ncbi:hypothetical protein Arad_0952 [Rhizobium rhizogenes K84]|uniref:Uncharacterized protein n=1 Tax=Rhizobium rhizogenes (strain K84 / ATCC BAA-868) TaxID=311403 RepID=B9J9C0_RHIR8|nr:hypothetical protein Arad_0952 [Rhizobium rhizogenes K84]